MNKFKASLVLSLISFFLITGCAPKPDGTYTGFCANQTYGVEADLNLILNTKGSNVAGSIHIIGDLGGSAPINGIIEGKRITFTSDAGDGMQIMWRGEIDGDTISGLYTVSVGADQKAAGIRDQQGLWKVDR